jgi:hypothetical protein
MTSISESRDTEILCFLMESIDFRIPYSPRRGERQSPLEGQGCIPGKFWKPMVFKAELAEKRP